MENHTKTSKTNPPFCALIFKSVLAPESGLGLRTGLGFRTGSANLPKV